MDAAGDGERLRVSQDLERSRIQLEASLGALKTRARDMLSPSRVVQENLGVCLVAAFALGVGFAIRRKGGMGRW